MRAVARDEGRGEDVMGVKVLVITCRYVNNQQYCGNSKR